MQRVPMIRLCPKCQSDEVKLVEYMGAVCLVCLNCGFDESALYEVYPDSKSSQKQKGNFSPYQAGGGARTRK